MSEAIAYRLKVLDVESQQYVFDNDVPATTSYTYPQDLRANADYTWSVAAKNAFGTGPQSSALPFTAQCAVPDAPVPIGPRDRECVTLTPHLAWEPAANADDYEVQVQRISNGALIHTNTTPVTVYVVPYGVLSTDGEFSWRVRARRQTAASTWLTSDWSAWLSFIADCSPPPTPTPSGPSGCIQTATPTFAWSETPRAVRYDLDIYDQQNVLVLTQSTTQPSFTLTTPLVADRDYRWRVTAFNQENESGPPSDWLYFTPFCNLFPQPTSTRPDAPPGPGEPCAGPSAVGRPVSVVTGNVFFDQLDLIVSGVRAVGLMRSYNSANVALAEPGIFGPGWSHPYESSVSVRYDVLTLRESDGTVTYYRDPDGDATYEPYAPATEPSTVVQLASGSFERRFRRGGKETFDSAGRLTSRVDAINVSVTVSRDALGRIDQIRDAGGRALTFSYTSGRLTRVAGPGGLEAVDYTYEGNRLKTVTYGDGSGFSFGYDSAGRILTVLSPDGEVLETHSYYTDGRAKTSEIAQGRELLTLVYEPLKTTVTDALGNATVYEYAAINEARKVVRVTGPCMICGSGPSGEVQEWTYDALGRVETRRVRSSLASGDESVTEYHYDSANSGVTWERNPSGQVTYYTRDPEDRILTITSGGRRTVYTYSPAGVTSVARQSDDGATSREQTEYDSLGRPHRITDPYGRVTTFHYDAEGDNYEIVDALGRVTRLTHDAMGRVKTSTDPIDRTVTKDYDPHGRLRRITQADGSFMEAAYDRAGRQILATDSQGRQARTGYDGFGRRAYTIDAVGNETRIEYDVMSRPVAIRDGRGNRTLYERDSFGRVLREVRADGTAELLAYDRRGRLARRTDRRGVVTTFQYDAVGRLLQQQYSDGTPSISFAYDAAGRVARMESSVDTLTWTYDSLDRIVTETSSRAGTTLKYTYDVGSSQQTLELNGSVIETYETDSDNKGRLVAIHRAGRRFSFDYDDAGRRESLVYPNSIAVSYAHDEMFRIRTIDTRLGSQELLHFGYDYDGAGNRTLRSTATDAERYVYDAADRLIEAARTGQGWRFGYDRGGNRVVAELNGVARRSTFNSTDQLSSEDAGGVIAVAGTTDESARVTVNGQPAGALPGLTFQGNASTVAGVNTVTVSAIDASNNQSAATLHVTVPQGSRSFEYDANGNMVTRPDANGNVWRYSWDAESRLTSVLRDGVEVARFAYDPRGRRVSKVAGGVSISYLYDRLEILRELRTGASGTETFDYVHGPFIDEPLARIDSAGNWNFYHLDGLGSVVATSNDSGVLTSERTYDAWGVPGAGAEVGGYAFTGREWDPEIGLYYYRARYYDPAAGRFLSEDPANAEMNAYAYATNNPATRTDPLGLWSFHVHLQLTYDAALRAGYNPEAGALLAAKVALVDFREGSQSDPSKTIWHAMSNPGQVTSAAELSALVGNFNALILNALIGGDLALALHARQDFSSLAHYPFREWEGGCPNIGHVVLDSVFFSPTEYESLVEVSAAIIRMYFALHPPPKPLPPPRCVANPRLHGCFMAY